MNLPHPFHLHTIVVQATPACNLNCRYCYLEHRRETSRMDPQVMACLGAQLRACGAEGFELLWHGGEPTVVGTATFNSLLSTFAEAYGERAAYTVITNGTLLDARWCELAHRHGAEVVVSIDGPPELARDRVDWSGKQASHRALRGIQALRCAGLEFGVLAVVGQSSLTSPEYTLDYLLSLRPRAIGFLIEEREWTGRSGIREDEMVRTFWARLYKHAQKRSVGTIHEFAHMVPAVQHMPTHGSGGVHRVALFPSVAWNGDVTLLSAEFLDMNPGKYHSFRLGNITTESFSDIIERGLQTTYVYDYMQGVRKCADSCPYYQCCGGGQAANKMLEHGRLDVTATGFCRNRIMLLFDALQDAGVERAVSQVGSS